MNMKKKILIIQIIQTIIVGIIVLISLLERNNLIESNNKLMLIYVGIPIITFILMDIFLVSILIKKPKNEKKIFITFILIAIELLFLGILGVSIHHNVDRIDFLKHCKETTAEIYNIDKDVEWYQDYTQEEKKYYYYKTLVSYYFKYTVNGENYTSLFYTSTISSSPSMSLARSEAENVEPEYKVNDKITIFYNTENPKDWRKDINHISEKFLYAIFALIVCLRIYGLIKGKTIANEE